MTAQVTSPSPSIGARTATPPYRGTGTGSYTINSDCTGSLTLTGIAPFDTVIVGGGSEIKAFWTKSGTTLTGNSKKQ